MNMDIVNVARAADALGEATATANERRAEDVMFEHARRAILYHERPPKPPTEVELLRREVTELKERLRLAAEVLNGNITRADWDDDW